MPNRHHRNANAAPPREARRRRRATTKVTGVLVELDPRTARLVIRPEGSVLARGAAVGELTVDARGARVATHDADGDGSAGLTDLFPGDRLRIHCDGRIGVDVVARRIERLGPPGPIGGLRRLWQRR